MKANESCVGPQAMRDGAALLADMLTCFDVPVVTTVPGEGLFEVLDALAQRAPGVLLATFRHEAGAVFAAQAIGQLHDRPGVCLVARAPGALNTCLAVHTAYTDSAPLLLIVGQAATWYAQREAFLGAQHLQQVFAPLAKWVAEIPSAAHIPEFLGRAWHMAMSGRRGPVVLILPEDVAAQCTAATHLPLPRVARAAPAAQDLAAFDAAIASAERPMMIVGGTGWTAAALHALQDCCAARRLPLATSYRRRDLVDHMHPLFCGEIGLGVDPALAAQVADADLLVVLNARLGEINTVSASAFAGYTLLDAPVPQQRLLHVHPDAAELNAVYRAELAIQSDPNAFVDAWAASAPPAAARHATRAERDWLLRGPRARTRFVTSGACDGPLDLREVYAQLDASLQGEGLVTSGAGGYALWPQRYLRHRRPGTQLGPKSGAMGYGLSAAIGAALLARHTHAPVSRPIVAIAGDGCFMMHAEELETAVRLRLDLVVLVINNRSYGTLGLTQQRRFGRTVGTALGEIDFAAFARSCGARGETVSETAAFAPALARALNAGTVSLIELRVPGSVVKPGPARP